jgi:hypothetical protein
MVKVFTNVERVTMKNPQQKPKSEYNVIPIYVRGDRKYINQLKSRAATADLPLADYVREKLDKAIGCEDNSFFDSRGNDTNQSGNV